jgi:hypothetical protein
VIVLMLVITWGAVNWALTFDVEMRVRAAVAMVLKLKRIIANYFG